LSRRREQALAERRQELVARSAAQRAALVGAVAPLVRKAAALDRVVAYVRRYPVLSSLAVAALALFGPRRVLDLGARALTLFLLLRH
jgi:hypothetical protein